MTTNKITNSTITINIFNISTKGSNYVMYIANKICTKCKQIKQVIYFYKSKTTSDGYQYRCKSCAKEYRNQNKDKISEYNNKYRKQNMNKISDYYNKNKLYIRT